MNYLWTVTMYFNRGQKKVLTFDNDKDAMETVRIAVFANKDCIHCIIDGQVK